MLRRVRGLRRTWPKAAWRLRGYGDLTLAGRRVRFHDIDRWPYDQWALEARRGRWEPRTLARFAELVHPGDTVLDVGAHFGIYALLASELAGPSGRVVAFEPDPVSRAQLEKNVRGAGASNVEVRPEAVADSQGGGRLAAGALGTGDTTLTSGEQGLEVPTVALSAFCAERDLAPDVLKVDVEGGEAAVLRGASPELLRGLRAVILEVHEPMLRERGVDPARWLDGISGEFAALEQLDDREPGNRTVALVNYR